MQVILSSLVYEKQQKLRAMMKMHGLGDIAYWTISYCYFLLISLIYMLLLVTFGSVVGNMIPFRLVWKSSIKFALLLPKLMVAQIPKKLTDLNVLSFLSLIISALSQNIFQNTYHGPSVIALLVLGGITSLQKLIYLSFYFQV